MTARRDTFQKAVCAHWQCPPEEFRDRVLAHCYHRHARPFLGLIKRLFRSSTTLDYDLIDMVGRTDEARELRREYDLFRHDHRPQGLLRGVFRCRVSGKALMRLAHTVWRTEAAQPTVPQPAEVDGARQYAATGF
jgi:hypothetical protein